MLKRCNPTTATVPKKISQENFAEWLFNKENMLGSDVEEENATGTRKVRNTDYIEKYVIPSTHEGYKVIQTGFSH